MTNSVLIKNASVVNEGITTETDVYVEDGIIVKIGDNLSTRSIDTKVIDAYGLHLLPGVIDDQVHFRDPGLTHKGDTFTETRAAVAGGITSYIEMPNTNPQTTTQVELEKKFVNASKKSLINYSFMMGGTNDNIEEILKTDKKNVAGLKLFLGSSTGNMLVDDEKVLENIFSKTDLLISAHCEDETTIKLNTQEAIDKYGEDDIPISAHPEIRSAEACYISSSKAVELAKKTGARLHVFHLSTEIETHLFTNKIPLKDKKITAEVCVHHLWFDQDQYANKGTLIKWNPAVKSKEDKEGLWKALLDDRIDVIATDHAPHTLEEKQNTYLKAPSGGPMVQHSLVAMLETTKQGRISVEKVVEKMCHNPAILFEVENRGFIREGYYADLVLVDLSSPWNVKKENILYKCGWSPMEGQVFRSKVMYTLVNGSLVFNAGKIDDEHRGMRLKFDR
ncbi:MAG: dihydroorotase [Ichthyobacteriaceae bacterium]|nr:dihydroorotase [Ichthyobacteriaceae bacterium]